MPTIIGKRRPVPKDDENPDVELDDNKAEPTEL